MMHLWYKTRGQGCSWLPENFSEFTLQLQHLILYLPEAMSNVGGRDNQPVLIGQISFVEFQKVFMPEITKPLDALVIPKRLSDVIDRDACVLSAWVWQEQDFGDRDAFGRKINHGSPCVLPNGMKLSFDEYLLPLGDNPAYQLFSAVTGHMLWHDRETFVDWLIKQGIYQNIERFPARNNVETE